MYISYTYIYTHIHIHTIVPLYHCQACVTGDIPNNFWRRPKSWGLGPLGYPKINQYVLGIFFSN